MKKISILSLLISISIISNSFAQSPKMGKWINLFNKKDLSGWKIYGTEKWYVDNGELVCESGPDKEYGYLGTDQKFKDFELSCQFKQEANGNSGVFFHSSIEGTKITGWQSEVAPPGHWTGGINALKMGKWNEMKVKVVGNNVKTYLNGQEMITFTDDKIGSVDGIIALQIHSGGGIKVKWRKIKIRQI
jgi:hypothetical protein